MCVRAGGRCSHEAAPHRFREAELKHGRVAMLVSCDAPSLTLTLALTLALTLTLTLTLSLSLTLTLTLTLTLSAGLALGARRAADQLRRDDGGEPLAARVRGRDAPAQLGGLEQRA